MGGINVLILRRDFTVARKKVNSKESHVHFGNGSYLNMEGGILTTQNFKEPPVLIFQEGNAVPQGVAKVPTEAPNPTGGESSPQPQNPLENVKWGTWYIPMLRGLNRRHHGRGNLIATFGKLINLKTLPFWIIGLAVLAQLLSGG
ncbi:MAG: hypothetical protein HWN68_10815 [Desulfobacterales bacterium]|nr:hypothetical protein [Desulfobacterales bacterium]